MRVGSLRGSSSAIERWSRRPKWESSSCPDTRARPTDVGEDFLGHCGYSSGRWIRYLVWHTLFDASKEVFDIFDARPLQYMMDFDKMGEMEDTRMGLQVCEPFAPE